MTFASRFADISRQYSPFCMGVDPSRQLLRDWGLTEDAAGLARFCDIVLKAAAGRVGICKPQAAFFEAFGPAGVAVLGDFIAQARAAGLLVIADIKRGDIGSTIAAYAEGWVGADSPFGADAVTATAYLGFGALDPLLTRAAETGAGVFLVVRSSNPEGAGLQAAQTQAGLAVADALARDIAAFNAKVAPGAVGPIGAVIGATLGDEAIATVQTLENSLFLVPGLGAQGADFDDVKRLFAGATDRILPNSSRGVLTHGPDVAALARALDEHVATAARIRDL
ncbi:MAG: orotidine-5'-phosphate decarboxylase [Magnetospiraceae bacterium]